MKSLISFFFLILFAHCSSKNVKATLAVGNKTEYTAAGEMQVAGSKKLTKTDNPLLPAFDGETAGCTGCHFQSVQG